jgi:gamma-aminobutyric acid receptor subunit alpha
LTITVLIVESKNDLHRSSHLTALDVYLIACFLFAMSSIVEFAWVHYENKFIYDQDIFTIYRLISLNKRLLKKCKARFKVLADQNASKSSSTCSKATVEQMTKPTPIKYTSQVDSNLSFDHLMQHISALEKNMINLDRRSRSRSRDVSVDESIQPSVTTGANSLSFDSSNLSSSLDDNYPSANARSDSIFEKLLTRMGVKKASMDVKFRNYDRVSRVDRYARVLYPLCFAFFNLIYWNYFLSKRVDFFEPNVPK